MPRTHLYDSIGTTYTLTRRTEPRIAAQVWAALGDAETVLNVGAGTGSYEPSDRDVTAVEPSAVMRAQRPAGAARCLAASAESLPFENHSFDAAMAFATVHHWQDPIAGLREMQRVARRVVVFTCDTSDRSWRRRFWLTRDYLPEVAASRVGLATELARAIGARMEPVLVPWDCADGFFEAYWRRPGTRTSVAGSRCGGASGRAPSSGQCADCVATSQLVDGPNATAPFSVSRRQSSGFAC
jgi:SAM-dependent methyltransferase